MDTIKGGREEEEDEEEEEEEGDVFIWVSEPG